MGFSNIMHYTILLGFQNQKDCGPVDLWSPYSDLNLD